MKGLFEAKCKEYAEKKEIDYQFLVDLATAALGGGKKEDELLLDDGEGLDEITPEQEEALRAALGSDYDKLYSNTDED